MFDEIPKKSWCVDGEKLNLSSAKYEIKIVNDIRMLVPAKNVGKLFVNNEKSNN